MNRRLSISAITIMGVAAGWFGRGWNGRSVGNQSITDHAGPTIEQIQELAALVTARIDVADVMETKIDGFTGGEKLVVVIKGDFLIGTDLGKAKFEQVDLINHHAVLLLPLPTATSPRLDHARTRLYNLTETGLWCFTPDSDQTAAIFIDHAYGDAQRTVVEAGHQPEMLLRSRRQAENVLKDFFKALGWDVDVCWSGP